MNSILEKVKGGLIVSCQALEDEPLHSSYIMSRMAYAAMLGGAVGIRANSPQDIVEIKKIVDLPVIGLTKKVFEDSSVFITPTEKEVDELVAAGCEIIATDGTRRQRPGGESLEVFFDKIRRKYPNQLFMADCSCVGDGLYAAEIGFDIIGTTLSGYTEETQGTPLPDLNMIRELVAKLDRPVIAEGGIWLPEQLRAVMDAGAFSAVVGTAITRPMEITRRFIKALQ